MKRQPKHCNPKKIFSLDPIVSDDSRLPVGSDLSDDGRSRSRSSLVGDRGGGDGSDGSGGGGDGDLSCSSSLFGDGHSGGDERRGEILLRLDDCEATVISGEEGGGKREGTNW